LLLLSLLDSVPNTGTRSSRAACDDHGMPRRLSSADGADWEQFDELDPRDADAWFAALVERRGEPLDSGWEAPGETPNEYTMSYALNGRIGFGGDFARGEPRRHDRVPEREVTRGVRPRGSSSGGPDLTMIAI
jgi:hypothetical protein